MWADWATQVFNHLFLLGYDNLIQLKNHKKKQENNKGNEKEGKKPKANITKGRTKDR